MTTVYSTSFLDTEVLTPGPPIAYIIPAGYTAVLRDVDLFVNAGVAAGDLVLSSSATGAPFVYFETKSPWGVTNFSWRGRAVFEGSPTEAVEAFFFQPTSGTNTWVVKASGYLLSL